MVWCILITMKKLITIILIIVSCHATGQKGTGFQFEYNQTNSPKVVALTGLFVDMRGKYYSTSVTIPAHRSILLIKLDQPPLALQVKSFSLSTGANTTTIRTVIFDEGIEKTVIYKHKFR